MEKDYTYTFIITFQDGSNRIVPTKVTEEIANEILKNYQDYYDSKVVSYKNITIGAKGINTTLGKEIFPFVHIRSLKIRPFNNSDETYV